MTREEAIRVLCSMDVPEGNKTLIDSASHEALTMAIDALSKPSLPSNLDEAAIKRMRESDMYLSDATIAEIGDALLKMAYFGAEWMAGQGASYNTEVGWIDGPTVLDWPDNILDEFKMGDKVIVQIRKK